MEATDPVTSLSSSTVPLVRQNKLNGFRVCNGQITDSNIQNRSRFFMHKVHDGEEFISDILM
jgi:hypothetical protein